MNISMFMCFFSNCKFLTFYLSSCYSKSSHYSNYSRVIFLVTLLEYFEKLVTLLFSSNEISLLCPTLHLNRLVWMTFKPISVDDILVHVSGQTVRYDWPPGHTSMSSSDLLFITFYLTQGLNIFLMSVFFTLLKLFSFEKCLFLYKPR